VTTIIGGFCGFSIAPMTPDAAEYVKPMLAKVEGMPLETLEAAVPWGSWSSFGEYLGAIDGKVGLNAGFFCGHSAVRRIVMSSRAVGETATEADIAAMKNLIGRSLGEGALGFSTTVSQTHNDGDGNPVPSRWASHDEIIKLGSVVKDYPGTGLELLPNLDFGPGIPELLSNFSLAGNRPVNWNVLAVNGRPDAESIARFMLSQSDFARERGGEVIALTVPCTPELFMNLRSGGGWDSNLGLWRDIFKQPVEQRIAMLRDPMVRERLAQDAALMPRESPLFFLSNIPEYWVVETKTASYKRYESRKVGDIAREEGRKPIDVMMDIAVADRLLTSFRPEQGGHDRRSFELRAKLWRDDRTLIGASDAGAHLDMIDTFSFSTTLLSKGVREFGVITLEEAIYQITDRQARYMGLIDRGRIAAGYHADIVVFDETTVGAGPTYFREDVPSVAGMQGRMYADAVGIGDVLVNGVAIVRDGAHTGALPGTVLHSGRDTRTVLPGAMREHRKLEFV
jgi:N-acyl-D-aspartate/D-glutamate deacylase